MGRHFSVALFVAAGAILAVGPAKAQNRNTGLSGGGASSFGGSSFGTSSFGSSFGQSGFGSSSFGSGFGQSGFGTGGTLFGSQSGAGQSGTATFVGRGGETAFVGRGAGLQQQNLSASQNRSSRTSTGDSGSIDNPRPTVRVRLTASPELLAATRRPTLSPGSARRLARRPGLEGVTVSSARGLTVLSGVVATESQRLVAEKLLAIEPGVGSIENRLTLAPDAPELVPAPR